MLADGAGALLVLLLALLLLLAWLLVGRHAAARAIRYGCCSGGNQGQPTVRRGGGEPRGEGLGPALLDYHLAAAQDRHLEAVGAKPPRAPSPSDAKTGGAPERPWTEYESWTALRAAPAAYDAYWRDRTAARAKLPADWTAVRETLAPLLKEDREWIGLINLVDGAPQVVHKEPGPTKLSTAGPGAELPAEVVERVACRPAMYLFHTHPKGLSSMASPVDASTAVMGLYGGHYAGHVIVAPEVIALYTPTNSTINRLWDETHPHLAAMRTALDVYSSVAALRSWGTFYSYTDFEKVCTDLGLAYYLFPGDGFMQQYYNYVFSSPDWVDTERLALFARHIEKAQTAVKSRKTDLGQLEQVVPHRVAPAPATRPETKK